MKRQTKRIKRRTFRIDPLILRYENRDIIKVYVDDWWQGFYQSSGQNSGRQGVWFPFDGIIRVPHLWFDKERFCRRGGELNRYGFQPLRDISLKLGRMNISEGILANVIEVNMFVAPDKENVARQPY